MKYDERRVAETTLSDGRWVSTVRFEYDGEDCFETMVFPSRGNLMETYCKRYATREEAKEGHAFVVDALNAGWVLE